MVTVIQRLDDRCRQIRRRSPLQFAPIPREDVGVGFVGFGHAAEATFKTVRT